MQRTKYCGEVRDADVGARVVLSGWVFRRRDHGGLIFIDLRDRSGLVQIVFSPEVDVATHEAAHALRSEYVIAISGQVRKRPEGTENQNLPTGAVELYADDLEVLNESAPLPFPMEDAAEASEQLRLKYRYLDLRRPEMQQNLILRHKTAKAVRDYFDALGFLEIETPMLTKSTPEGARDYIVPSRVNPGQFFALPQSPQLFKQILMAAGMERYFQIVKCFRDEDLRADRQPEFTQIDIEMSFVQPGDVMNITEGMIQKIFRDILSVELTTPFMRLSYADAMERYGNDKPDLRFGLELADMAELAQQSSFKVFLDVISGGGRIKALRAPGMAGISRKEIDLLSVEAQSYGAKGLAWIKVRDGFESPIAKFFPEETLRSMAQKVGAEEGDMVLFVADGERVVNDVLSRLRLELGKRLRLIQPGYRFVWVYDFPLLDWDAEEGRFVAMHHPFTSPCDPDIQRLMQIPESDVLDERFAQKHIALFSDFKAKAYDVVLNGYEIGGGSVRIHRKDLQRRMFAALGISDEHAAVKFGFLLDALNFGAPPHGGIALGLDRIAMLMVGASSIRDVIAFPKTQKALCLMSGAPSFVEQKQLRELFLKADAPA
ncbi:MAG TPA: aspartate--tRNA ligase [Dissulfurispiraceae bacterium]|nr:aspartate--tRNA ligase [Dissulfurispiraceae bacterium]